MSENIPKYPEKLFLNFVKQNKYFALFRKCTNFVTYSLSPILVI